VTKGCLDWNRPQEETTSYLDMVFVALLLLIKVIEIYFNEYAIVYS